MKPLQRGEIARNRHIRRDGVTRRTSSSRSMMEYDKWVQGIKASGSNNRSPGAWSSRILPNSKSVQFDSDEEFHWLARREDSDADGATSPILWKKLPSRENSHMTHDGKNACPSTRTQEIAVYRKEMMEMVRGLPEGDLELTLRDIVEKRKESKEAKLVNEKTVEEFVHDEKETKPKKTIDELVHDEKETKKNKTVDEKETKEKKSQKKDVSVARSNSMDTGLLIRMFLPLSVAVRRKSFNLRDRGEKVAVNEVEEKKEMIETKKTKDEEWWKKDEFSEKDSKASSIGSSSSNSSNNGDDHFSRNMSM